MGLFDQWNLSRNEVFNHLIEAGIVHNAIAITTEATGVASHAARVVLAKSILNNPPSYVADFSIGVADATGVQANFPFPAYFASGVTQAVAETNINSQISAIFNSYI